MIESEAKRLISAREAESYVPPLKMFAGCYKLRAKLLGWLNRPPEHDANLLIEGEPGTGKTSIIIAYLREQFKNPWFYREEFDPDRGARKARGEQVGDIESEREWPTRPRRELFFQQIDGATDTEVSMRRKIDNVRYAIADHRIALADELGEAFFRGYDEMYRPLLTEGGITVYATAQNFHSKRKSDSSIEEDQRLAALIRRFSHRERTENPTDADHLRFLAFLIGEWSLKIDAPSTLRMLMQKAEGIVGYSKRILIKAIDEPDRRLTRKLVEESDVNPV